MSDILDELKKPKRKALRVNDTLAFPLEELNTHLEIGWKILLSVNVSSTITYIVLER